MRPHHLLAGLAIVGMAVGLAVTHRADDPDAAHDHDDDHGHHHKDVGPTGFTHVVPIFNVLSVESSIEHYTTKLGFTKDWDWPDGQEDKTFASVTNGNVSVFFCERCQGGGKAWLSVYVKDVDAVFKQYQASGATIVEAPADQPWGLREMLVEDMDGNRLRVGSFLPHGHGGDDHEH